MRAKTCVEVQRPVKTSESGITLWKMAKVCPVFVFGVGRFLMSDCTIIPHGKNRGYYMQLLYILQPRKIPLSIAGDTRNMNPVVRITRDAVRSRFGSCRVA